VFTHYDMQLTLVIHTVYITRYIAVLLSVCWCSIYSMYVTV